MQSRGAMVPEPVLIRRMTRELRDTFTCHLDVSKRPRGFHFAPGQFNMLYVFGVGEVPISISSDPQRPDVLAHTVRAVGTVTHAMRALKRGDTLGVRGPYGTAWPLEAARNHDVVIIAGGLGLAPLRSAIHHIVRQRGDYRRVTVMYGARTPDDVLYHREIAQWQARGDLDVNVSVDRAPSGWSGHAGVVTSLLSVAHFEPEVTVAMICGPELMMRFAARDLLRRGVQARNVFVSMERNMKCAVGFCGHCQYGPMFVCKDGPVLPFDRVEWLFSRREI